MSEERAFLKAIGGQPEDHTVRLVYADWLEERDDPRGQLIRIEEEIKTLPVHSDRYWELKPRRRELLKAAKKPWLAKLGYGGTDYQPVFADVPTGWKERWRLLREFAERWHGIPMQDVGGRLKPVPVSRRKTLDEAELKSVDEALGDPKASAAIPPAVREWPLFVREMLLGRKGFSSGSGDRHFFWSGDGRVVFFFRDGGRDCYFVRAVDTKDPDPPVWESGAGGRDAPRLVSPHITTFALHYLLLQFEPEYGEHTPGPQEMTAEFTRRAADAFPVRSRFDETHIYERPNVIVLWFPNSPFTGGTPTIHSKARPPATEDEVFADLWD